MKFRAEMILSYTGGGGGEGAGEATGLKLSSGGLDSATESNPGLFKIYSIQYHTLQKEGQMEQDLSQ
jgi:hypothetical protein